MVRDIAMQSTNMAVEKPPPYTMQLLLEEVTTLRRRVKEMEDDGSRTSGRTVPSTESHESSENHDVPTLRKQLMKVENERAELEKDFMNQLAALAQENRENVEKLEKQLKMAECEKNIIKANGSFEQSEEVYELEQEVAQLKAVIAAQGDEGTAQLVKKLSNTEKELKDVREENKGLQQSVEELDAQKTTLLEEITHMRIDFDKEAKTVTSLRTEMEQMEKDYNLQIEKFQNDFMVQEEAIHHHEESFGEMHDSVVELEGQKALLLDEITGLRLQLDREKQTKADMKSRIEELTTATMEAGDYKLVAMEKRATAAEDNQSKLQETIDKLQDELRLVTGSYNADISRLEERVASRDSKVDELKVVIEMKEKELKLKDEVVSSAHDDVKALRRELENQEKDSAEKEHEIASMVSQRISYEKRATRNIMDHVAEVDDLRAQVTELEEEVDFLKKRLHEQKQTAFEARMESPKQPSPLPRAPMTPVRRAFSTRSSPNSFHFPGTPPPPPPPPVTPQSRARSRSLQLNDQQRTRVGGIVAQFERSIASHSSHGPASPEDRPTDESDISMSSEEAAEFENHQIECGSPIMVRELQDKLQKQSELVGELRAEIVTLSATRGAQAVMMEKEFAKKSREDEDEIVSLKKQLEDTQCKLESETELVKALRDELNILAIEKMSYVETGNSREQEQKAHTAELNKLTNAITAGQMEKANMERNLKNQIKQLEDSIETMNAEIDAELAEKQEEVDDLQRNVEEQLANVQRLEREREQICMNINSVSNSKKAEIDELHEELMAKTTTAANQAREINSLQMQVGKQKDATEELEYLRMRVRELEKRTNVASGSKHELDGLRADNHKLNDSLRKMSLERRALQEKLTAVMQEKSASKSVQVLRERNEALKKEVERLSRRIRKSEKGASRQRIEI